MTQSESDVIRRILIGQMAILKEVLLELRMDNRIAKLISLEALSAALSAEKASRAQVRRIRRRRSGDGPSTVAIQAWDGDADLDGVSVSGPDLEDAPES